MAMIPTKRDLGPLGQLAARPQYSPPKDYSGEALQGLGTALQRTGQVAGTIAAQDQREGTQAVDQARAYASATDFDKFESAQRQMANDAILSAEPGAKGLSDAVGKNYDIAAREFFKTIPEELKPKYDEVLVRTRSTLRDQVNGFEVKERSRFEGANLDDTVNRKVTEAASDPTNPKVLEDARARAAAFIQANPYLTLIEKDAKSRGLDDKFAKTVGQAINADPNANAAIFAKPASDAEGSPGRARAEGVISRGRGIADYYQGKGLSPVASAGIAGALMQENGGRFDGKPGDNGISHGAAQWNGARFTALKSFAAARGTNWTDGPTQMDFILHEMDTGDAGARRAGQELRAATTPEQAADAMMHFERPQGYSSDNPRNGNGYSARLANTKRVLGQDPGSGALAASTPPSQSEAMGYFTERFPGASPEVIQSLAEQSVSARNQNLQRETAIIRANIDTATTNAPVALQNTGSYDGPMSSAADFQRVYGLDGSERYQQFQTALEVSQAAHGMQTMPAEQIQEIIKAAKPQSSGNDAALEQKLYDTLSTAGASILKSREADPVSYAQQAFPNVREAWEKATNEPGDATYSAALRDTAAAQDFLGIPPDKQALLPKPTATSIIDKFKDATKSDSERAGSVLSAILSTPDKVQRRTIFNQLVDEGLPPIAEGVLEAAARNDTGAANRLMQAVLVDPKDIGGKIETTPGQIDDAIQTNILASGTVGATVYGLSYGDSRSFERAARGTELVRRATQLRMRQGESLESAISGATKDLFGDKTVYVGSGKIDADLAVDKDVDQDALGLGLAAVKPRFQESLTRLKDNAIAKDAPSEGDQRTIVNAASENRIADIINSSVFVQSGDGIGLRDPYTGLFVAGEDGQPLTIPFDQVLSMGMPDKAEPSDQDIQKAREQKFLQDRAAAFGTMGGGLKR